MLWVSPFVSPDSEEFRYLKTKGYLVKRKGSDQPAILDWWNGSSACYDLSNPDAYNHLRSTLKKMQQDYHIDGFKFDAGRTGKISRKRGRLFSTANRMIPNRLIYGPSWGSNFHITNSAPVGN